MNWRITTLATVAVLAACSDSTSNNNGGGGGATSSSFTGIATSDDGFASGALTFTIPTTSLAPPAPTGPSLMGSFNVTGSLVYDGGAPVALTGTYDNATDILALTGGGFTFGGGFDGVDRIEGLMSGTASGTFVSTKAASANAYCGTYTQTVGGSDQGTFSFVIAGSIVRGSAVSSVNGPNAPIALDGTISGNAISIHAPGSTAGFATGTLSGSNVSGTWDDGQGSSGTWTGTGC